MDVQELKRREEFLKTQEGFRQNALKLIDRMLDWCNRTPGSKHLVDEMLHCIFFLGKINTAPYSPIEIIGDQKMLDSLEEKYPRPFQLYSSQLPRRSPFSCVTDMVVLQKGQENENQIKETLKNLINGLEKGFLVSSTICVSNINSDGSVRYYGVSMSTNGKNPGRIVTAASCLSAWEEYVAGAVMTYDQERVKKSYFDGTIKLPQRVRCQAFNLSKGDEMEACESCGDLFGLTPHTKTKWPYGNCAEVESLSNLLKNEEEVKRQAKPQSDTCTPENRQTAQNSVLDYLKTLLRMIQFNTWDNHFYIPQP